MGYRILAFSLCFILISTAVPSQLGTLTAGMVFGDSRLNGLHEAFAAASDEGAASTPPQTAPAPASTSALDRHSEEIRTKVLQLGASARITVKMKNHQEFYGTITRVKTDFFELEDVDQKRILTIQYVEVQKVHEGFGAKNTFTGRRVHPHGRLIGLLVVGGLLITLIAIAATQRD